MPKAYVLDSRSVASIETSPSLYGHPEVAYYVLVVLNDGTRIYLTGSVADSIFEISEREAERVMSERKR